MSESGTSRLQGLPRQTSGTSALAWWGMILLFLTEGALFGYFIASYFNLRLTVNVWPPDGIPRPELLVPSINTLILISSSVAMIWAERGIRKGSQGQLKLGLTLSFLLGATFLGIQALKVSQLPFTVQTDAYGSIFLTLTGFHAAHVVVGLIMSAMTQFLAWLGYFNIRRFLGVQTTAMYWHFVDIVWIFVFATLHISPYFVL